MSTDIEQIKALQELAREYGLNVVITAPDQEKRKPTHSNAGKNYRTKKTILTELAQARHAYLEAQKVQSEVSEFIKQARKTAQEASQKMQSLQPQINALTNEAIKKGATSKELESTRIKRKYVKRK